MNLMTFTSDKHGPYNLPESQLVLLFLDSNEDFASHVSPLGVSTIQMEKHGWCDEGIGLRGWL